jgi:hypothetical protein
MVACRFLLVDFGRLGGLVTLCALAGACGGEGTKGKLTRTQPTDDTVELRADWSYSSFKVDVSLTLITKVGSESCVSTGTLSVDEALSATKHYELAPTDCSALKLGDDGDIVLQGEVTGHDWADESLSVDTDKKVISLGPATGTDADGNAVTYLFTLSSPTCPDGSGCECPLLRRIANGQTLDLPLGRRC